MLHERRVLPLQSIQQVAQLRGGGRPARRATRRARLPRRQQARRRRAACAALGPRGARRQTIGRLAIGSAANYNRADRRKPSSCLQASSWQLRHGAVCRGEVASPVDFLTLLTFVLPVVEARAWKERACLLPRSPMRRCPSAVGSPPPHRWGSAPGTPAPGSSGHRMRRTDARIFFIPAGAFLASRSSLASTVSRNQCLRTQSASRRRQI